MKPYPKRNGDDKAGERVTWRAERIIFKLEYSASYSTFKAKEIEFT